MANPFASHSSGMDAMLPLMMMSMTQKPPEPTIAPRPPQGTPLGSKTGDVSSFVGGVSPPPTPMQLGGKTLLGQ